MNLKFFILGLYVLVSIAQVKSEPNGLENDEINDNDEALDRKKRQNYLPPLVTTTSASVRSREILGARRFNPLDAISNVAQKPLDMVFKKAMDKLFSSYSDTSKPFGPTYDTTWGSPEDASNRKMNVDDQKTPEEIQMSTMIQPPPGQSGYYTYGVQKIPMYYGNQNYGQTQRNFGHSPQPNIPYESHYDNNVNGKQTVFKGQQPGYFPYQYGQASNGNTPHFAQGRRNDAADMNSKYLEIFRNSPEEINKLLAQLKMPSKGREGNNANMRNGFLGDVYDKSSEEKSSAESYTNTQVEFNGATSPENRKFAGKIDNQEYDKLIDKLWEHSIKGVSVSLSYLVAILDTGNPEQIGQLVLRFYKAMANAKDSLHT